MYNPSGLWPNKYLKHESWGLKRLDSWQLRCVWARRAATGLSNSTAYANIGSVIGRGLSEKDAYNDTYVSQSSSCLILYVSLYVSDDGYSYKAEREKEV